jgi:flagellar basal-body rod protein FlgG
VNHGVGGGQVESATARLEADQKHRKFAGLEARGQNLYAETAASGVPQAGAPNANGLGALQQGFVEGSNVNVVEELVSMIATQRAYELNSKAIQTSDQMLQRLGQL